MSGVLAGAQPNTPPFGNGKYTEITGHPLAADNAISQYRAPDPTAPNSMRNPSGCWILLKKIITLLA
jgi:hypothetical protein